MAVIELRGIDRPVGLFGLVRKMMRVFGPIASVTRCSGKKKSCTGGTSMIRAPRASAHAAYMSNAGWTTIASKGSSAGAPRRLTSDASMIPSSSPLVSTTLSTPMSKKRAVAADDRVVVGVDGGVLSRQLAEHASDVGRAAGGVLVEVEAEVAVLRLGALVLVGHRAWADPLTGLPR